MPDRPNVVMPVSCLLLFLSACGGGGTGTTASALAPTVTPVAPTPPVVPANYNCDTVAVYAKAEKIAVDKSKAAPAYPGSYPLTFESWPVQIDGITYKLNARVALPKQGVTPRGVWLFSHGISAKQETAPKEQIAYFSYDEARATSLGYIAVTVARRGNYGSEGTVYSPDKDKWIAQYQSRQISYSQFEDLSGKYLAGSEIAALNYMKMDVRISPYLNALVLSGYSGGAESVMYVAAGSPVFRDAQFKAIIRGAGRDSANDTNPDAFPGYNESMANLSTIQGMVPALWYDGTDDTITSPSKLACTESFYNRNNGLNSRIVFLNGYGHGGSENGTADYQDIVVKYLRERNMPGF